MNILVVGGSYFLGRVFVMGAAETDKVTLVNRGTYSMESFKVKEYRADRHDTDFWRGIKENYDVIVDFCAYNQGDISQILENIGGSIRQYIFISTVDVYRRGISGLKGEDTPFETRNIAGDAGSYIAGKVALEKELIEQCAAKNINYTVLRPAILYGPYNYAPRESAYIQMLVQNRCLPKITDADGRFQFVYVKDAATAIRKCMLNETAYNQAYNLCQDEISTYSSFFDTLKQAADIEFTELSMTMAEAEAKQLPLPFPLTKAETELYSNQKSKTELGLNYIDFAEGMKRTYNAFKKVFEL